MELRVKDQGLRVDDSGSIVDRKETGVVGPLQFFLFLLACVDLFSYLFCGLWFMVVFRGTYLLSDLARSSVSMVLAPLRKPLAYSRGRQNTKKTFI